MQKSNTMMLIHYTEEGVQTFGLMPISLSAPYIECRFLRAHKALKVITATPITELRMIPALDFTGNIKKAKVKNKEVDCYERVAADTFYDFMITDRKDIETLVNYLDDSISAEYLDKYFEPIPTPELKKTEGEGVKLTVESKDGE